MGKRILITGGAGCLGSNLVEHYSAQGHAICVMDNFATSSRQLIPQFSPHPVVEGTIADGELVNRTFDQFAPTHVIHSAAAYKDPNDWHEDIATNVVGTLHVARAARRHGVSRLVHFQTALCYGRATRLPIPVDHPVAPFTSYGISKVAGEAYLMQSGLSAVSLRLANICGPRLSIGPIPTFYRRLKEGKSCFCSKTVRDFLDMSDFLSLMDLVLEVDAPCGIFNVSTGEGHGIRDVFEAVASHLGLVPAPPLEVEPGPDDVRETVLDPSRTSDAFGWRPRVSFAQTMARQLQWYDSNGVAAVYSHLSAPKA